MILDVMTDAYIFESDSDTVIPYVDLVNVLIQDTHKSFRLNFDFNVNISNVFVSLATTSGVTASGFYSEIKDLGYPCVHYSFDECLDQVNENYLDLEFENHMVTQISGVMCSGMLCNGNTSYLKSSPFFLFGCAYTNLLYFKQLKHVTGITQDNLFFRAKTPTNNEVLDIGITEKGTISVGLYNGSSIELFDTGLLTVSGSWNLLSIRCQPKTKLRIGCSNEVSSEFVEINRSCAFLGGSTVLYLGGHPSVGYFDGALSDYTWWPSYCDNIFIENAWTYPEIALNGQRRSVNTTITSSGVNFDLDKNYPSQVYLEFYFPTPNMITGISPFTYDDNYVLASGVDTLFCGTIVRDHTSTDYPVEIYNNTDHQTYAYVFAYDPNRYRALSVSNDAENYYSNHISLPNDISWVVGEFKSYINNEIIVDIPHRIKIESNNTIILYDSSRQCLWCLSKDTFGFYDIRTNNFYTRTFPSFTAGETGVYSTKYYWDFGTDNNSICLIYYNSEVYKYNIISDNWSFFHSIPVCDNVCISTSEHYIFYSYYYLSKSEVFRYDISSEEEISVCSFSVSSLKIASNEDVLFVFNGNTIFKYDIDTLNIIAVSQNIGLSNVLEIKDFCCYISIITTTAIYKLDYFQNGWGVLSKVYNFSSSFSISTVNSCVQSIAFVKSNEVYLTNLSHYRYRSIDVNTHNNYNNTLSLLPVSPNERYKIVWAWLDTGEGMPNFYLASKFSIGESIIYGFSRDTTASEGVMSVFMSFNFITKKCIVLNSIVSNNLIDVENGCLVETYDAVYYINFNKGHYYKYVISTDTWFSIPPPKTYDSVSNCTAISAVYDLNERIYIAGVSLGGYISSQSYEKVADRYYSFFGYIDINTDIIHSLYYLPYSDAVGWSHGGINLSLGGTFFTCELNYNSVYNYLFLVVSQYTSRALIYTFNMSTPIPSGSVDYIFDSLEDLYDYGCIIYSPFTGSISRSRPITGSVFNNLMNNYYFYTNYSIHLANSDIPERTCLYIDHSSNSVFKWEGGSIGLKTDYNFSVNVRIKVSNSSNYHMPTLFDSNGKEGFEVGFDENDKVFACCRKDETYISSVCSMESAGVVKGEWVDLGASLSCVSGTDINLYINGNNVASSHIPATCSGYNSSAVFHLLETTGSPYLNNASSYYYNHNDTAKITELTVFNKVLSDTAFSGISYTNSEKPIARILMDYNVISDEGDRLPLSAYIDHSGVGHWDGQSRVYSIYDYTSDYIYYLSDYTLIKFNVITSFAESSNLRAAYNSECDYNFGIATIKGSFFATNTNTFVGQSEYGIVYIGDSVFDDFTEYYSVGSYVSPIIDVGETGIITYNSEYDLVRDSYLEFYVRYANDKPVDFCHIYYIDNTNTFIESSLATGKMFDSFSVSLSKSCDVYYDNNTIKVTIDGSVYDSSNYTTPTNTFSLAGYSLANVTGTWFSYNGSYILYHTSDKYLVGFPLSIGIPCMRSSVVYSSINHVAWSKYAQYISIAVDEGVYIYDYMLGEKEFIANAYRVFYTFFGPMIIKSTDNTVLLNKLGVYYTYVVDDIDFSRNIEFDYNTEWIYYVTLDGNLKRMRYVQSKVGYELEFLDTGITGVNNIYKVTFDYIILIINTEFVTYNKIGFVAVSNYPFLNYNSGNIVFFDYNPTNKVSYYNLEYLSDNDLIWSDLLYWIPLGSKSSGFILGKKYVQLKVVFKASSDKTATPILRRIYFGSPVRVGPVLPHAAENFFVKLDVPLDDQGDIYSVKLITLAEDIVS